MERRPLLLMAAIAASVALLSLPGTGYAGGTGPSVAGRLTVGSRPSGLGAAVTLTSGLTTLSAEPDGTGAFAFSSLADGEYTLRATRPGHLARSLSFSVEQASVIGFPDDLVLRLPFGDLDQDGVIGAADLEALEAQYMQAGSGADPAFERLDPVADGLLDVWDIAALTRHYGEEEAVAALRLEPASGLPGDTLSLRAVFAAGTRKLAGRQLTFEIGGQGVGTAATDSEGAAVLLYPIALSSGHYPLRVSFAGDSEYPATGTSGTLRVQPRPGTLLVSSVSQSTGGTAVLAATLAPAAAGKVISFSVDGVPAGTATTDGGGTVTLAYGVTQSAGVYTVRAAFAGDAEITAADGQGYLTVMARQVKISVDPVGGIYSDGVTLTAVLTPPVGGKQILFTVDGVDVGTAKTDDGGQAQLPYTVSLPAGPYEVGAGFAGDGYLSPASGTGFLTVKPEAALLTYTGDTVVSGGPVNLSARLTEEADGSPGSMAHAGTVQFLVKRLDGTVAGEFTGTVDSTGVATATGTGLPNAPYDIEVSLPANNYYWPPAVTAHAKATAGLAAGDAAGQYSDQVRLSATVSPAVAGKTVTFTVDGTVVGSGTTDAAGLATVDYIITNAAGSHTIGASFAGDADYSGATGSGTLTASQEDATLVYTGVTVVTGGDVSLSATVTESADGSPGSIANAGTVQFLVKRLDGTVAGIFTGQVNGDGIAAVSVTGLANSPYNIEVSLLPNGCYFAPLVATRAKGTSSLTAASAGGQYSDRVKLKAIFVPAVVGKTVNFTVDGAAVGSSTTDEAGLAYLDYVITEAAGSYSIGVSFAADSSYRGATGSGTLTVTRETAVLAYSGDTTVHGGAVSLSATVTEAGDGSPGAVAEAGTVEFVVRKASDGTTAASAIGVVNSSGVATATTAPLPNEPYTVDISLGANGYYEAPSTSAALKSVTSLTVGDEAGQYSDHVTLTARLTPPLAGMTVSFTVGGTVAGTATTGATGTATFDYRIDRPAGSYPVGVSFAGSAAYGSSSAAATLTVSQEGAVLTYTGDTALIGGSLYLAAHLDQAADDVSGDIAQAGQVKFVVRRASDQGTVRTVTAPIGVSGEVMVTVEGLEDMDYWVETELLPNQYFAAPSVLALVFAEIELAVAGVNGEYGANASLQASLRHGGSPVAGAAISFMIQSVPLGTAVTNALGIATLSHVITESAGAYAIDASFAGDATLGGTGGSGTLTVMHATGNLVYQGDTLFAGGPLMLKAQLTAANGTVTRAGNLQFVVIHGATVVGTYTAAVDETGTATVLPAPVLEVGGYTVTVSLPANGYYTAPAATANVTAAGDLTVPAVSGSWGSRVILSATLSPPAPGRLISFTIAEVPVGSASTDAAGYASFTYTIDRPAGSYWILAAFAGDATLGPVSNSSSQLTVTPASATLSFQGVPAMATVGQPVKLTVALTPAASGKEIVFDFGGQTVTASTDAPGLATATGTFWMEGSGTVGASFDGDGFIGPVKIAEILTVTPGAPPQT